VHVTVNYVLKYLVHIPGTLSPVPFRIKKQDRLLWHFWRKTIWL